MLAAMDHVPVDPVDWETAARLHRTCQRQGEQVWSLSDCLVAAVAIRIGAPVLAHDRDFVLLARHTDLEAWPDPYSSIGWAATAALASTAGSGWSPRVRTTVASQGGHGPAGDDRGHRDR